LRVVGDLEAADATPSASPGGRAEGTLDGEAVRVAFTALP